MKVPHLSCEVAVSIAVLSAQQAAFPATAQMWQPCHAELGACRWKSDGNPAFWSQSCSVVVQLDVVVGMI